MYKEFTPPHAQHCPKNLQINSGELKKGSEEYFRNKIILFSFLMGVVIVYQHVRFGNEDVQWLNELHLFRVFLGKTCVPMFFAISGYLFFRGFKWNKLKSKLHRRVHTLLIPYLIWNILYVIFMVFMSKTGLMTSLEVELSPQGIIIAILNAECSPLWFLRYLMLFVIISPIAYFVLRNKLTGAVLLLCMLIFNYYNYTTGKIIVPLEVNSNTLVMFNYQYTFFALGAYGALNWSNVVESFSTNKVKLALITILILSIIYWTFLRINSTIITSHAFRFLWIPTIWFAFDALPIFVARSWMKFSFFVYCSHMFVLYCIQGSTRLFYPYLYGFKPAFVFIEYILVGIVTVYILIQIVSYLKRVTPMTFKILTGSRG